MCFPHMSNGKAIWKFHESLFFIQHFYGKKSAINVSEKTLSNDISVNESYFWYANYKFVEKKEC